MLTHGFTISKRNSCKSTKREPAMSYDTDDVTEEDKHDYNDSYSDEESKMVDEKDDDSDDDVKMKTCTWKWIVRTF